MTSRGLAILAGGLVAAGLLYVTISEARQGLGERSKPQVSMEGAPGSLAVLPDGRRIDFICTGQGSPTVLLESGFGAGASAWGRVQPRIAAKTRVCAYDRAGFGFSDPGPMPRDGAAIARDLDFGLKAARIRGPYVVVGHSAGGLYARLFAARRRQEVVGLVFVDSSVEHQTQRMEAMFGAGAGSLDGLERRALRCLKLTSGPRSPADDAALLECAPLSGDAHTRQVQLRPETYRTQVSELENLFTTTSDEVDRTGDLLRDIPAIVLTAAKGDGAAGVADDPGAAAWQKFHRQLAGGFLRGDQRLVKSGHLMMFDRPEVIAGAALELVDGARKR
jgi:pimeloyl-ACP methyl ester carboxylesterase